MDQETKIRDIVETLFQKLGIEMVGENYGLAQDAQRDIKEVFDNSEEESTEIEELNERIGELESQVEDLEDRADCVCGCDGCKKCKDKKQEQKSVTSLSEKQKEFEEQHKNADEIVANKLDGVLKATYLSPKYGMRKLALEGRLKDNE